MVPRFAMVAATLFGLWSSSPQGVNDRAPEKEGRVPGVLPAMQTSPRNPAAAAQPSKEPQPQSSGRERVAVEDVFTTSDGVNVLILRTQSEPRLYVPIALADLEALAIRLRLGHVPPPRPMTLDLLETVLASNDIRVIEIVIEDIRDGMFVSHVRLQQNGKLWDMDARPCDAVGLAISRGAPIWVTKHVLDDVGIDPRKLAPDDGGRAKPPSGEQPGQPASPHDKDRPETTL